MSPQEALNILIQATGLLELNRAAHAQIQNALSTLNSIIPVEEQIQDKE